MNQILRLQETASVLSGLLESTTVKIKKSWVGTVVCGLLWYVGETLSLDAQTPQQSTGHPVPPPFSTQLPDNTCSGRSSRWFTYLIPRYHGEVLEEVHGFWIWPALAQAVVSIGGVSQWMKDKSIPLFLPLPFSFSLSLLLFVINKVLERELKKVFSSPTPVGTLHSVTGTYSVFAVFILHCCMPQPKHMTILSKTNPNLGTGKRALGVRSAAAYQEEVLCQKTPKHKKQAEWNKQNKSST